MEAKRSKRSSEARVRPEAVAARIPPEKRRKQLLAVATQLVAERGAENVTITDVAERAKVSRPLVYRLFPTRQALVSAVLDDFGAHLSASFAAVLVQLLPGSLFALVQGFVQACCSVIEERGAGPWRLLDGSSGDPELARLGPNVLRGVLAPWETRLAELTGRDPVQTSCVLWVIVAAGRAALDGWVDGRITREQAVSDATRAITALLEAFAKAPEAS